MLIPKRIFDIAASFIGLILLFPLFIIISIAIKFNSNGPVFYIAPRVGQNEKLFPFVKFRTMHPKSDYSPITIGNTDPRITMVGLFLRRFKLDELPQLLNVLLGHISFVGPRPDVPQYKEEYKKYFKDYYKFKPGITCYSTIYFRNESELYIDTVNPEHVYVEKTIPQKVEMDIKYFHNMNLSTDINLIMLTISRIVKR
jgi:lipopolysaccharide/colanic/teichoic acid biosynthesis glycosyltransferase